MMSEQMVSERSPVAVMSASPAPAAQQKLNLLDMNRQQLREFFSSLGRNLFAPIR
ncbi:hypothetical protein SODG_004071 [Sodalis praecaptivus]